MCSVLGSFVIWLFYFTEIWFNYPLNFCWIDLFHFFFLASFSTYYWNSFCTAVSIKNDVLLYSILAHKFWWVTYPMETTTIVILTGMIVIWFLLKLNVIICEKLKKRKILLLFLLNNYFIFQRISSFLEKISYLAPIEFFK